MSTTRCVHRRKAIQYSDPGKILNLVMNLIDDSCAKLQIKLNSYLCEECEADVVFQILVHTEHREASIEAIGTHVLPKNYKFNVTQKIDDILKSDAETRELLSNLDSDVLNILTPYIPDGISKKYVVILPISNKPFALIFCVVAPKILEYQVPLLIHECFLFTWPIIIKSIELEYERNMKQKCQSLLRVAKKLFTQVSSLDTLLNDAIEQGKQITKAKHCIIMLIDANTNELIYTKDERRFPINKGITGEVLRTGTLINVKNLQDHSSFDPDIDNIAGVNCRNLLCFPIREQSGIIGVGQLVNKIGDSYFDAIDEEIITAFSIYCGICIIHSIVYQKIQEAHIRNALANELILYHMKVSDQEVLHILECTGFHQHPHLNSLEFNPRALPLRELPCYIYRMFTDLGFVKRFNIKQDKLARFILYVKKGFRDVPYHNWMHAFCVTQWVYATLINFKLITKGYLTDLQGLMYLLAGLIHDLDHRGTTSTYYIQGRRTLAALFSSEGSVMERHHLAQALCILNTEGCDILESLPRRDYDRALIHLRDFILATDLSNYFKNQKEYKVIAMDFQRGNRLHTNRLSCLLMNCADFSDQLKDWASIKKTTASMLMEFFKQGDMEEGGEFPSLITDKDQCFIPNLAMEFLQSVCIPLYETLAKILPEAESFTKIIEKHIEQWEASKLVFAEVPITSGMAVLLSSELDNLIEQNIKEKEREELERLAAEEASEKEDK